MIEGSDVVGELAAEVALLRKELKEAKASIVALETEVQHLRSFSNSLDHRTVGLIPIGGIR